MGSAVVYNPDGTTYDGRGEKGAGKKLRKKKKLNPGPDPTVSPNPTGSYFAQGGLMAPAKHGKGPSRVRKMPDMKR